MVYKDFEEEFIESWTDMNEFYRTAAELDKLWMQNEHVCYAQVLSVVEVGSLLVKDIA